MRTKSKAKCINCGHDRFDRYKVCKRCGKCNCAECRKDGRCIV